MNEPVIEEFRTLAESGWKVEPTYGLREKSNAVSLYFGKQTNGADAYLAFAYKPSYKDGDDHPIDWSITKLDKWGGTGSRKATRMGSGKAPMVIVELLANVADVEARSARATGRKRR